jgi:hypothetical protein
VAETDGRAEALEYSEEAAEAHSIVLRVRRVKGQILERLLWSETSKGIPAQSSVAIRTALNELAVINRYERRALSRRNRALRFLAMMAKY